MELFITIILLVLGIILIVKGGDAFVDAASWMAKKTGIPDFVIGATIVSIATTMPEMLVSFMAAGSGKVDIAIGNAIGSVNANIGLIMGVALIFMPTVIKRRDYMIKSLLMLFAALILAVFAPSGKIGITPSILLAAVFVLAMVDNVNKAKEAANLNGVSAVSVSKSKISGEAVKNIVKFIIGAAGIAIGSKLLIDSGSKLAMLFGVPERIIAISVIAIGTSLPELVTAITSIIKKQASLSLGNIIGANIIDLALILPISSLIAGQAIPVSKQFAFLDIPACLMFGCIAVIPALIFKKFSRFIGICLVLIYIAYIIFTTSYNTI